MTKDELEIRLAVLRKQADDWLKDGAALLAAIERFEHGRDPALGLRHDLGSAKMSVTDALSAIRNNTPTDG